MTKNFQEKLQQGERKQSKGANNCASIRRELECETCSKTFCKTLARPNQTNAKHSSNSEELKTFWKNLTLNSTPLTLPHLKL